MVFLILPKESGGYILLIFVLFARPVTVRTTLYKFEFCADYRSSAR